MSADEIENAFTELKTKVIDVMDKYTDEMDKMVDRTDLSEEEGAVVDKWVELVHGVQTAISLDRSGAVGLPIGRALFGIMRRCNLLADDISSYMISKETCL
jgi:hypothetical protein